MNPNNDNHTYFLADPKRDRRYRALGTMSTISIVALLAFGVQACKTDAEEKEADPTAPGLPASVDEGHRAAGMDPSKPNAADPAGADPAGAGALGAAPAGAGSPPPPGPEGTPTPPGAEGGGSVTKAEIDAFVDIQLELAPMQQEIMQKGQAGASPEEVKKLQDELQARGEKILAKSSLSETRFQEIVSQFEKDAELQSQVRATLEKRAGEAPQPGGAPGQPGQP